MREEGFEEESGGDLVDEVFAVEAVTGSVAGAEERVRFACRKALVEEVVRESRVLGEERLGEGEGLFGLETWGAVGVKRVADDEGDDLVFANQASNGLEVSAQRGAVKSEERLRGEIERVGYRQADAPIADIQSECAAGGHEASLARWLRNAGGCARAGREVS